VIEERLSAIVALPFKSLGFHPWNTVSHYMTDTQYLVVISHNAVVPTKRVLSLNARCVSLNTIHYYMAMESYLFTLKQ
jgi:hypothetical protein